MRFLAYLSSGRGSPGEIDNRYRLERKALNEVKNGQ